MQSQEDTIAAIVTPPGSGGIAVVRLSGAKAIEIVDSIFTARSRVPEFESHKAVLGKIGDSQPSGRGFLDQALVTVFKAPRSYTGENVVEISCHGGEYLSRQVLELILRRGARAAEPGEFTQRAFLNGKMDLSQAEAVADLISAKTERSLQAAAQQYRGVLSEQIREMRQSLIDVCSLLELELDFAEEDVQFANKQEVARKIETTVAQIDQFIATYKRGKILREGAKLVIVGKPNVGKSSLLNALLKEERAIVTDIPGTTRDTIEEQIDIRGVLFRIVDTAGVRNTTDRIEKMGVERTRNEIARADVILFLFDGSQPLEAEDWLLVDEVYALRNGQGGGGVIGAINKCDLQQKLRIDNLGDRFERGELLTLSAKELIGISSLEEGLVSASLGESFSMDGGDPMITNLRQKLALEQAREALVSGLGSIKADVSSEFVAVDLRAAMHSLGEIIGEVTTEDILGNIFSRFCIGK